MVKTFISTEAEVDKGSEEEEIDYSEAGESLDRVYVYKCLILPIQMMKPS